MDSTSTVTRREFTAASGFAILGGVTITISGGGATGTGRLEPRARGDHHRRTAHVRERGVIGHHRDGDSSAHRGPVARGDPADRRGHAGVDDADRRLGS